MSYINRIFSRALETNIKFLQLLVYWQSSKKKYIQKKMTGKKILLGLILVGLTCSYPLKKVSYVGDIDISSVY